MANYNSAPKQTGKRLAAAIAAAVLPLTGCSQPSNEQIAMRDTTRQVFTDLIAGKVVSKSTFGPNTFTISRYDKYPNSNSSDAQSTNQGAIYTYDVGEERMNKALMLNDNTVSSGELKAMATCDTAAVNSLLTPDELKQVQDTWDYYQQLGGQKELNKGGESSNDAYNAITKLALTCRVPIHNSLKTGADVTFVPAVNS